MGDRPAAERAEGRVRASETFKAVLDTYMAGQRNELKPHSYVLKEPHLLKHCRSFHSLALTKIDRRAVASKLASVESKSSPVESNRTRASLSAFYTLCISEGYVETNPVTGTNRRGEKARDRTLTDAELNQCLLG
jgi:hypothetical protein